MLFFLAVATVSRIEALSSGIWDVARPEVGCWCHGGTVPPNTVTNLVIDGLPPAWVAGESYDLTLWVLGAGVPSGITFANAFFGFNLEVSAGTLEDLAGTAQVANQTECALAVAVSKCDPHTTCGVTGVDLCRSTVECYERRCSEPGTGDCRPCSSEYVYVQATHSISGGMDPIRAQTDGNSLPTWTLRWTAPESGGGDVTFYMAGNAVNGGGAPDIGDNWAVLDPPIVIPAH